MDISVNSNSNLENVKDSSILLLEKLESTSE